MLIFIAHCAVACSLQIIDCHTHEDFLVFQLHQVVSLRYVWVFLSYLKIRKSIDSFLMNPKVDSAASGVLSNFVFLLIVLRQDYNFDMPWKIYTPLLQANQSCFYDSTVVVHYLSQSISECLNASTESIHFIIIRGSLFQSMNKLYL